MIGRAIFWTLLFLIGGSIIFYHQVELPLLLSWFGKIPGDHLVKISFFNFYFPLSSSALCGALIALISK